MRNVLVDSRGGICCQSDCDLDGLSMRGEGTEGLSLKFGGVFFEWKLTQGVRSRTIIHDDKNKVYSFL